MTNHPNRNWRQCWTVDLEAREARHIDGFVFRFERAEDDPRAWDGKCITCPPDIVSFDRGQLARIAREAGEIWSESKKL